MSELLGGVGANTAATQTQQTQQTQQSTAASTVDATTQNANAQVTAPKDTVEKGKTVKGMTYGDIQALKNVSSAATENLRNLVSKLIVRQGDTAQVSTGKVDSNLKAMWGRFANDRMVTIDEATRSEAARLVSEDGEMGVKKVSERILQMAEGFAGGDPAKLEKMRGAIEKGFEAAEKVWGGQMPDITKQTHKAVMDGLDALKAKMTGSSTAAAGSIE